MEKRQTLKKTGKYAALAFVTAFIGCASDSPEVSTDAKSKSEKIADLQVVDCLLPGQTRMLGNQVYITPRRPVMTTASDCRIRGGEYVAYDRADYKTALNVWMASAESGDAEAQANVGEIFERGLGSEPNYEAAIIWYKKAADQGNKRALFNLGTLYEQGLGVDQDKLIAMNYYRQAWGLPEDSLVYQSALDEQQKEVDDPRRKRPAAPDVSIGGKDQPASYTQRLLDAKRRAKHRTDDDQPDSET